VLRHVAESLTDILRAGDIAARGGGEEFVVLVTGPDTGADQYAQRLTSRLREAPAVIDAAPCPVTLSIGIACSRGREPMQVVAAADAAMYEAKLAGRDRVCREVVADDDGADPQA
jgi:diguanylate cyclase (GGDEF)-like protein